MVAIFECASTDDRCASFSEVTKDQWNDWNWQLRNRVNSVTELSQIINLADSELAALQSGEKFRVDITPYFASLIDKDDVNCPIRRQVIPLPDEFHQFTGMMTDSLGEEKDSPVPNLVHRYPDRVLMLVTTHCASYCRYCTRSRIVGDFEKTTKRKDYEAQLEYIRSNPQIRDVLLSGGDPLTLSDYLLDYLLGELRKIPHIEIVRIGSRVPIFLPQRITPELCKLLKQHHPLWINVHINHPKEITPALSNALGMLADAGIPLGNQSVLLKGINDSVEIQKDLVHKLVQCRVRPYYLYQCDLVKGAGHFRTSIDKGLEIIRGLQGWTSGYAVPTYAIDAPGGGGKVPISPQNLKDVGMDGRITIENFEGELAHYYQPIQSDLPDAAIPFLFDNAPKCKAGKGVHGWGLIADQAIAAGEMIIDFSDPTVYSAVAFDDLPEWRLQGAKYTGISETTCIISDRYTKYSLLNHSDTANALLDISNRRIVAARAIKPGEEVCTDYNVEPLSDKARSYIKHFI